LIWVNQAATGTPYKLYVGNAGTPGGIDILQSSVGNKLRYNTVNGKIDLDLTSGNRLNTDDIIQLGGASNKFFTNELAQDAVGAMFAAGTMSGITFVYDDVANKMNVTVTATGGGGGGGASGITSLIQDPSPTLGGTFQLNSHNITGTGNINITGNITATGTIIATTGLGADLPLNGFDISGVGNITLGGNAGFTGTIRSDTGLGGDLALNGYNLTGLGDINVSGLLSVGGLGYDLSLNGYNLTGSGNINTTGNIILSSGNLTLISGGATLSSGNLLISSGDVSVNGNTSASGYSQASKYHGINIDSSVILESTSSTIASLRGVTDDGTGGKAPSLRFNTSRGTLNSPSNTLVGDKLASIQFQGYYEGNYVAAGSFRGEWDSYSVLSSPYAGGTLFFATGNNADGYNTLSFDSKGVLKTGTISVGDGTASKPSLVFTTDGGQDSGLFHPGDGIVCVSINATERARFDSGGLRVGGFVKVAQVSGTLPSPAEAGMIVLDGTTFKGYNGSAWVNLN
jgi:hypothetical protein